MTPCSLPAPCSGALCEARLGGSLAPRALRGWGGGAACECCPSLPGRAALAPLQSTGRTHLLTFPAGLGSPRHQHPPPSHGAATQDPENKKRAGSRGTRRREGQLSSVFCTSLLPAFEMAKCHCDHTPWGAALPGAEVSLRFKDHTQRCLQLWSPPPCPGRCSDGAWGQPVP